MLKHKLQLDLEPRNSRGRRQVTVRSVSAEGRQGLAHSSGAPAPTVRPEMGEKVGRGDLCGDGGRGAIAK